jgi:hypothetical protein
MAAGRPSVPGRAGRVLKRAAMAVGGFCVASFALIGFAHTRAGRPLLRYIPGMGACPMGFDHPLSPAERDQQRSRALLPFRGTERAASRPALGFALGRSTRSDVAAWQAQFQLACHPDLDGTETTCAGVPQAALGGEGEGGKADEASFFFDPQDRLVAVNVARRGLLPAQATQMVEARAKELSEKAGPSSRTVGTLDPEFLAPGRIAEAAVEFRFSDYHADVSATQMGELGLMEREQYQLIDD